MIINRDIEITKKKTGEIVLNYYGQKFASDNTSTNPTGDVIAINSTLNAIYRTMLRVDESQRTEKFKDIMANSDNTILNEKLKAVKDMASANETEDEKLNRGLTGLMGFFTEFNFEPNFRFVNTLVRKLTESSKSTENDKNAKNYIRSYFELSGSQYNKEIEAKMKSDEFASILSDLSVKKTDKQVNSRLKIYYGSAGTGKTTLAMQESEGRVIVCNSSMLPADIMCDFDFNDGKAEFRKSSLWEAMEKGEKIVLDEINLLPFDSLRFLQGILDGKKTVSYKGEEITIKDGFEVIGTMNLAVNGMVYGLPEPLVDRCEDIRKFNLSAKDLLGAIL